jgi:hypothetical protein
MIDAVDTVQMGGIFGGRMFNRVLTNGINVVTVRKRSLRRGIGSIRLDGVRCYNGRYIV